MADNGSHDHKNQPSASMSVPATFAFKLAKATIVRM